MPRANRYFMPGYVWHITHRCHQREFLLKFGRDRGRWRYWLFEARKRFGLSVLNYIVTSNHIHLLVRNRGNGEVANSMQLIAGRTAQEYNQRKQRRGAYWEDRYHATAVDTETYLNRCMAYIDMNMVRAGAVTHPGEWYASGYREIQNPPKRYRIIDLPALMTLLGVGELDALQAMQVEWVDEAIKAEQLRREGSWSESLAVGSRAFIDGFQADLGIRGRHRVVCQDADICQLREMAPPYSNDLETEINNLRQENTIILRRI